MPRKTKESNELTNLNEDVQKEVKATKKTSSKKGTKSTTKTSKALTTKKTSSSSKKEASKKSPSEKSSAKKTTTKKKASTTSSKAKSTKASKTTRKKEVLPKAEIVEYYDLPYRYNQTIVKVLAQTPTTLFIYWDISDDDRENYKKQYGDNFFETTKPILIVYNDTLGYHFEIEINDFANSWYLHVADSKCDYRIELGRRPISENIKINTNYIYITTSNKIESPNDKILLNKNPKMVYFRNVKTGINTEKNINTLSFMRNMGRIYNIYDFYKQIYGNENIEDIYNNPSSGNPSSSFK